MKKGFTLVELMAVIAILGILAIVAVPNVIKLFSEGANETMSIQENQVLDSAKLYLEDYCRNPIDRSYLEKCNSDRKTFSTNSNGEVVYFCISTIKNSGHLKDKILYKSSVECDGIVMFNRDGKKYTEGKTYLYCGDNEYATDGYNKYESAFNSCGITVR